MAGPLWTPSQARIDGSQLTRFQRETERLTGRSFASYADLHQWSVDEAPEFWARVWDHAGVIGDRGARLVVDRERMPGARFLPDARLNYAENLLRGSDHRTAIVAVTEDAHVRSLTLGDLKRDVARVAHALRASGVTPGDRVAGVMANVPEAVIALLACATIGAVWSSCSPDFGADGIVDRFGQIEPVLLIGVDGYAYGGKRFDCRQKITEVVSRIASIRTTVMVQFAGLGSPDTVDGTHVDWTTWSRDQSSEWPSYERWPFDHPLYILYSSGTTGVPKCIVHRAGGALLEHIKEHQLQADICHTDRIFYFTTCGWMMWNWLVSALASEATIVLFDGSPFFPDGHALFTLADRLAITVFGTSAKWIDSVKKAGIRPRDSHRLDTVRTIVSTGSPLLPESFVFVYESIKRDVHLTSVSGGTDIVGCFVGGNPNGPVWPGEIQAAGLGLDVRIFDDHSKSLKSAPGELVCASPFPSMPLGFWNDPDGVRYREAYFERFPGVWRHGDWAALTEHDGFVIYGRSDTTLNPGGVRIGTAEIYRQVEFIPEVLESLAVCQTWEGDERILLFVRLAPGAELDAGLKRRIVERLKTHASPRHVPARILQVSDLPRTRSGKVAEMAARKAVAGEPIPNSEALANPASLDEFRGRVELES
ncbi:MAG: acetoacetate--CoA ligase [Acidobacteriota bacterium]